MSLGVIDKLILLQNSIKSFKIALRKLLPSKINDRYKLYVFRYPADK